jgi:putative heme-binding domain-containing protein
MVRWQVLGPISPETAASLVAQVGLSGRPSEPTPGDAHPWRTLFATGTDGRLRVPDGSGADATAVCLGSTDFTLSEPAAVQLLASSNGTLRIWADGNLVLHRTVPGTFQPDSDRIEAELGKGPHRLVVEVNSASRPPEFQLRFRRKGSTADQERLVQTVLTRAGDPERGRKVFEDVEKSQCLKCHRMGDRGEKIGPELSRIGGRFARITIIESILEPSRSIAPSYESVTVALADGRVLSGVRGEETERVVMLGDQEGRRHAIPKADIETMTRQPVSTMPDGLAKRLTAEEFADLIAYLAAQK